MKDSEKANLQSLIEKYGVMCVIESKATRQFNRIKKGKVADPSGVQLWRSEHKMIAAAKEQTEILREIGKLVDLGAS